MASARRRSRRGKKALPRLAPRAENGAADCPTAFAAEALRTGVLPRSALHAQREDIPREGETMRIGDPDDHVMANEYVGEETPGGTTPTPDQNDVDEIGRAYGLLEEDSGALRSAGEILERRDRHRDELIPPRRRQS